MSQQPQETKEKSLEDTLKFLNDIREETGQISELTTEENMLVTEFLGALLRIMQPLAQTLPISTSILPEEWGKVIHASLDLTGQLLVLYPDERMESIDLTEQRHRELLLKITFDIMPKLKRFITSHRQKIEARVDFMSSITKELQKTARAFSPDGSKQSTISLRARRQVADVAGVGQITELAPSAELVKNAVKSKEPLAQQQKTSAT